VTPLGHQPQLLQGDRLQRHRLRRVGGAALRHFLLLGSNGSRSREAAPLEATDTVC
jgi:hypothetical protein